MDDGAITEELETAATPATTAMIDDRGRRQGVRRMVCPYHTHRIGLQAARMWVSGVCCGKFSSSPNCIIRDTDTGKCRLKSSNGHDSHRTSNNRL